MKETILNNESYLRRIEIIKQEERERILKIIPKTWLDHLLKPYLNKKEFTPKDIENILMMIREEIKQSSGRENGK